MQRARIVKALDELPLFAWAVSRVDGSLPARQWPPAPVARNVRSKPEPPPAHAIWKPRNATYADARFVFGLAARGEQPAQKSLAELIAEAVQACPRISHAIGKPDIAPASLKFQSAAWIMPAPGRINLELAYQGPKEHLADAIDALTRVGLTLGLTARTTTAQISPLRTDKAPRGQIGWRATVAMIEQRGVVRAPERLALTMGA